MDCNTSVLSTLKNTNMNIRKKKKMKKINGKNVTAGARAGSVTDTGFIGGDRQKNSPN